LIRQKGSNSRIKALSPLGFPGNQKAKSNINKSFNTKANEILNQKA